MMGRSRGGVQALGSRARPPGMVSVICQAAVALGRVAGREALLYARNDLCVGAECVDAAVWP